MRSSPGRGSVYLAVLAVPDAVVVVDVPELTKKKPWWGNRSDSTKAIANTGTSSTSPSMMMAAIRAPRIDWLRVEPCARRRPSVGLPRVSAPQEKDGSVVLMTWGARAPSASRVCFLIGPGPVGAER